MKRAPTKVSAFITPLAALTLPAHLNAQQHTRYKLIDVGTLGGPHSYGSVISPFRTSWVFHPRASGWCFSMKGGFGILARPTRGGSPVSICDVCNIGWSHDGKFLYVRFRGVGDMGGGNAFVIGLPAGKELPALPDSGLKSVQDVKGLNVVAVIDMTGVSLLAPGPNPTIYAYARMTVQRNLFRIPLN